MFLKERAVRVSIFLSVFDVHVNRHPVPYAVGAAGLLLAATLPVLGLRVGLPDDGSLPERRTERRACQQTRAAAPDGS